MFTSDQYEGWRKKWITDKEKRKLSHYLDEKDETPSQEEDEDYEEDIEEEGGRMKIVGRRRKVGKRMKVGRRMKIMGRRMKLEKGGGCRWAGGASVGVIEGRC